MAKEKILLTIAARGGSKGVKNKNIRNLCGRPLIGHTILQAKRWGGADRIICSTDSDKIALIARRYGAEVPFVRPARLSGDRVSKINVLRHALKTVEAESGEKFDIIIDLDVTAPVRKIGDIEGSLRLFFEKKAKSVLSATISRKNPYFNMVEQDAGGRVTLAKTFKDGIKRRQDAPPVYDLNASIYVYRKDYLLDENTKSAISDKSFVFLMDDLSAFDIDTEHDFQFIEFLVTKGLVRL